MKIIDLLKDLYDGKEVPKKIKYGSELFVFNETYKRYINDDGETLGEFIAIDLCLNDEIEIIEQETTYEQNFTGWKMFQSGKVVYSYGYDKLALKPADVVDVEKDIKEMLEEKPKKIEKLDLYEDLQDILNSPDKSIVLNAIHKCLLVEKYKINELIDYLLEKESDK